MESDHHNGETNSNSEDTEFSTDKDSKKATELKLGVKRKGSSVHDVSSESRTEGNNKRKKSYIDMATVEGQLAHDPRLSITDAQLQAKREYNRQNAARARVRNREMVEDLQKKVKQLMKRTEDLQRDNEVLQAQVKVLQSQQNSSSNVAATNAPQQKPAQHQSQPTLQQVGDVPTIPGNIQGSGDAASLDSNLQTRMAQVLSNIGLQPTPAAQSNNLANALNQLLGSNVLQTSGQGNTNGIAQALGQTHGSNNQFPGNQPQRPQRQNVGEGSSQLASEVLSSLFSQQNQQQQNQNGQASVSPTGAPASANSSRANEVCVGNEEIKEGGSSTVIQRPGSSEGQEKLSTNPMLAQLLGQVPPNVLQSILSEVQSSSQKKQN